MYGKLRRFYVWASGLLIFLMNIRISRSVRVHFSRSDLAVLNMTRAHPYTNSRGPIRRYIAHHQLKHTSGNMTITLSSVDGLTIWTYVRKAENISRLSIWFINFCYEYFDLNIRDVEYYLPMQLVPWSDQLPIRSACSPEQSSGRLACRSPCRHYRIYSVYV
jgi:hypothetical protein